MSKNCKNCGAAFFAFITLILLILNGYVSAIICMAVTILLIPPLYRKIPKFSGKNLVSSLVCVIAFFAAVLLIPEEPVSSQAEVNEEEVHSEGVEMAEKEEVEDEFSVVIDADGKLSEETYRELYHWIDESINCFKEQSGKLNEKETEMWAEKIPDDLFYEVWCNVVTDNISSYYALDMYGIEIDVDYVSNFVDYMNASTGLYDKVFPDNEWMNDGIKFPVEVIDELKNDIASLAADIPAEQVYNELFYISQRLDNNAISKTVSDESSWVAYGVSYDTLFETYMTDYDAGVKAVIVTTIRNPFSKADTYQIQYTNTGETRELETSNGFVTTVPVYRMVSMGDNNQIQENVNAINQCWSDIGERYYELMEYLH